MNSRPNQDEALSAAAARVFAERLGTSPAMLVRAPGRVNLIGEHTDYNDGFVMPMAIDREVWIALSPRDDRQVRVYSLDYDGELVFSLDTLERGGEEWGEYVKGTAWALQDAGHTLQGWDGVMTGNVPMGAGLSSSAALELATARAFFAASELPWDPVQMALLSQRAENQWVGVQCGIMDQMISAVGKAGHAVLIDCRSLEAQLVPVPSEALVVILDTATRRGLVGSAYNERRQRCEAAAAFFGVEALRDVSADQLQTADGLDPIALKRARHVVTENERTLAAAQAMRAGDAVALGQLMNASHVSLRDDFEVSSRELDVMVEVAQAQPGCFGARMTGAGFGGCAVALVERSAVPGFVERVASEYQAATGYQPNIYVSDAREGASTSEI